MAEDTKVLFADGDITVHVQTGEPYAINSSGDMGVPVESRTLVPGQFVPLADLPPYLREAALERGVEFARVLTLEEAEKALAEAEAVREGLKDEFNDQDDLVVDLSPVVYKQEPPEAEPEYDTTNTQLIDMNDGGPEVSM